VVRKNSVGRASPKYHAKNSSQLDTFSSEVDLKLKTILQAMTNLEQENLRK